eukprot:16438348-Heterocapsa_arctica.AAC.1
MVLCLAANKGRSSSPLLKPTLHLLAAYSLATGSHIAVRWIPSEYNPSDGPSRGKRPDGSPWARPRDDVTSGPARTAASAAGEGVAPPSWALNEVAGASAAGGPCRVLFPAAG